EEAAALLPAVRRRRHAMNARLAALDDVGRHQRRQALEPQAGPLRLAVAELPWLDRLSRGPVVANALLRVPVHHRVLDAYPLDRSIPARAEQVGALIELGPHIGERPARRGNAQPADAAVGEPGAGRMR